MDLCLYACYSPYISEIGYVIDKCSRLVFIWLSMRYRVIVQVLIPLIHCSRSESLISDSTSVHFILGAFDDLPMGSIDVKMGYLVDVECTSSNRYIQPAESTQLFPTSQNF